MKRIYPESKTGLINYIEENFHSIDQFVITLLMKDGTSLTVYDTYTYLEALGLTEIQRDCIHEDAHNDCFICKKRLSDG
ncbi:hypothetical protein PBAT_11050 [Paenibacillus antarcticus]|uniref:Uncharacterized protein n=1 Tax=Paenibacillus antarcticus TaxID=253703 RepID=A0A168PCP2_9BACL|nr:hypothetical protein PBAT_11050 [Paenibacillus antarcticus]